MASPEPTPDLPNVPQKTCITCGETKPETAFALDWHSKRGKFYRRNQCQSCRQTYRRTNDRLVYHADIEHSRAKQRIRRATNPERFRQYDKNKRLKNPEKAHQKSRAAREKNGAKWNASRRARYASDRVNNAAKIRTANQNWRAKNPAKAQASSQRRYARYRARSKGLPVAFTEQDREFCFQYWGYACAICGHEQGFAWTLALDHFIPITHPKCPGTVPWNLIPLCHGIQGCNNAKNDREAHAWLEERFGKRKAVTILKRIEAYFAIVKQRHPVSLI